MENGTIKWKADTDGIHIPRSDYMDIDKTLECGQCFRWRFTDGMWKGVVGSRTATIRSREDGWLVAGCSEQDFRQFWAEYLDLGRDYRAIESLYKGLDPRLDNALDLGRGIRILRQPFWETVVSFILSANNNIPRIQGMIERLCGAAGEPLGDNRYSFPDPHAVAKLTVENLRDMKFGYRAAYVIGLAQGFQSGRWSDGDFMAGSTPEVRKKLLELPGVGPKVADCILLYGLGRMDAFPVDTWIRKTLDTLDQGKNESQRIMSCMNETCRSDTMGYVQQVLFYSARYRKWGS